MKTGLYDRAMDILHERIYKAENLVHNQQKNVKPFRSEPVSLDEQIYFVDNASERDMFNAIQKYGADRVNELIYKVTMAKQKRGIGGGM